MPCSPVFEDFSVSHAIAFAAIGFVAATLVFAGFVARRKSRSNPEVSWWLAALQVVFTGLFRVRYRLRVKGLENVPVTGGVILASNHISFIESVLLSAICRRRVRFLTWDGYNKGFIALVIKILRLIPVSPKHAKEAIRTASECLAAGDCAGIFPEGQISRNGTLGAFQGGCALMARRANVPVVPVAVDGLWGSLFSFYGKGAFKKLPRRGRPLLTVAFGEPIPPEEVGSLRDRVQTLLAEIYAERPQFRGNLGAEIVKSLARHPGKVLVVDRGGAKRLALRGATLLALARRVARELKPLPDKRIGILLPPGAGAAVANIACLMLGKSPVNLNFTLGAKQFEACVNITEVKTYITAQALKDKLAEKVPDFPWDAMGRGIDIALLLKNIPKARFISDMALAWLLPAPLLRAFWRVPSRGGDAEATVLCTSGSSGLPKGVPLSHRNILGNCSQFDDTCLVRSDSVMLGNLPIFHSFGITVTLWFTLMRAVRVVNTPSPLELARNIAAIREERVTLILGTPTFYRGYMKKATAEDFASVQLSVAGAEKMPESFAEEWEARFGGSFMEGYGATETTPVACINLFDIRDANVSNGVFVGNRRGSVGRPLCGIAVRFTNPLTNAPDPDAGILWLKGVNIFSGYIGDPQRTSEVLTADGWYCTGDIARRDADGFIHIEGRQSRFSKIAGEMVPHGTVEDAVRRALDMKFGDDSQQRIAVSARFDKAKGESLVLLTTLDIDADALRAALAKDGLANLWIPRIVKRVDTIPVLATGKLDLQGLRELAAE
jgi:acyl-[acyl-carrier-protein]-phospholipid O-acyltransferase/long-chain-fatty-acid--[acyl-carrier-protein] ligase